MNRLVYIGGSMSNRDGIAKVAAVLRIRGLVPFYDWIMPGEETDQKWREFSERMGETYLDALESAHAKNVFEFDKRWLDRSDAFVLVLPAGRSAHLEAGYMIGQGKPVAILLEEENSRWDVMYRFAGLVTDDATEAASWLDHTLELTRNGG